MGYTFRLRFNRSPLATLETNLSEIKIAIPERGISVFLRASLPENKTLKDAGQWVLVGEGYHSENKALEEGEHLQDALMIALARVRIGVNFGDRSAKGQFTAHGLQSLEASARRRVLNNVHGLMVYQSEPQPAFAAVEGMNLFLGISLESFEQTFSAIIALNQRLTDREKIAFSLFNSSFFQPVPDSRFLLLMMSIETLIDPQPKSPEAVNHVDGFIDQIRNSTLDDNEKYSLMGSLRWLRDESINKAGQRLVKERLGEKIYEGKVAREFFSEIYEMRSRLVHGGTPFPTFREVNAIAAPVEVFVSELLTAPFLHSQQ